MSSTSEINDSNQVSHNAKYSPRNADNEEVDNDSNSAMIKDVADDETISTESISEVNKVIASDEAKSTDEVIQENAQEQSVCSLFTETLPKDIEYITANITEFSITPNDSLLVDVKSQSDKNSSVVDDVVISETSIGNKQVYRLKWIEWQNKKTPIVTQNENGPCPLIAIVNILLLRGKINLRPSVEFISASDLMDYVGDTIMESIPKDLQGASMLNYEQNMHDAIAILPQLHTGLDVNIKFTGVQHFEYTPECIIFDLLNIPLYHGWLVDPQCQEIVNAVGNLGYNQLVEKIILDKCSPNPDSVTEALIAEQFLERTASQLTYHGLCELNSSMKQGELAVLFRNNHFSTILKKKHELFQLVTDQGFLHEPRVVWETLCNIEGDGQFVDCRFATVPPKPSDCYVRDTPLTEEQQINQDYLVALSLQEDQKKADEHDWQELRDTKYRPPDLSDEELAQRLQEDAHAHVQQRPGRAPSPTSSASGRIPPSPGGERGKKGSMCNVM